MPPRSSMREGNESPLINIAHIGWGDYGEPTVSQRAVTLIGVGIFLVANCNSHLPRIRRAATVCQTLGRGHSGRQGDQVLGLIACRFPLADFMQLKMFRLRRVQQAAEGKNRTDTQDYGWGQPHILLLDCSDKRNLVSPPHISAEPSTQQCAGRVAKTNAGRAPAS